MRLPPIIPDQLSEAQRSVYDAIAGSARGGVRGPFLALLHSPELASRVEQLGRYIRYDSAVPERLRELAILAVARHWRADYEWVIHAPFAEKQGLPRPVIETFGAGKNPDWPTEDDALVAEFCQRLLAEGRVPQPLYDRLTERLGTRGATDLVGLVGYYTLLALTLNAHEVTPTGATVPWAAE